MVLSPKNITTSEFLHLGCIRKSAKVMVRTLNETTRRWERCNDGSVIANFQQYADRLSANEGVRWDSGDTVFKGGRYLVEII